MKAISSGSFKNDMSLLLGQVIRKTSNTLQHLNDYIFYCKKEKIHQSQRAISFIYDQLKSTLDLLMAIQITLECNNCTISKLMQIESEIRVAIQSIASINLYLSWRSPLYSQSMTPQFFNLQDQQSKRILYERWEHKEIERIELQMLKIFGLSDSEFGCTVVNSGMAAFSLVESFLIRNFLKHGDSIVMSPNIYFESREQLRSLNWLKIIESKSYNYKDIIKLVEIHQAKAIFVDILTNTEEQRMVDIPSLLDYFHHCTNCPLLIIDGTMLPCATIPYIISFPKKENIFYFESCSKYLQLGLDMSIAGILIYDVKLKHKLDILRRNMGLMLSEHNAHLFPIYKKKQLMDRIHRIESNACIIAGRLSADKEIIETYDIIYPNLSNHPDHSLAQKIDRYGGCIIFKCKIKDSKLLLQIKMLAEILMKNARANKVPIGQGLSFGFSFPRVHIDVICTVDESSNKSNKTTGFLRLYHGDQAKLNEPLIKLLTTSLKEHKTLFFDQNILLTPIID